MTTRPLAAGPPEPALGDAWSLPRMFGRGMVLGIVIAILVVGMGATAVLRAQSEQEAENAEEEMAERAGRVLQSASNALAASLAGASAIVSPSGTIDQLTFEAFAQGTVSTTGVSVLGYVPLVRSDDRAEFETDAGLTITQVGPNGLIAAEQRPEYLPIQFVYPMTETTRSVIGFDTASDPHRLATSTAALQTGTLMYSVPLPSQPTGETSVFFAQPLFAPGVTIETPDEREDAIVGFASGLTPSRTILASVVDQLPKGARVSIVDDDIQLATTEPAPRGGHNTEIVQGGRTWTIMVEHHDPDHGATWLMFFATLVLAGAVAFLLLRNFRQTRELRLAASNVRELGRLSERLATAQDRDEMINTILDHAGPMVEASAVSIAMWFGDDYLVLSSTSGPAERLLVDASNPIGAALVSDTAIYLADGSSLRAAFPGTIGGQTFGDVEAVVALPLHRPNGDVMGAIQWSWQRARALRAGVRSTLLTTAEVCQQNLYRNEVQQSRWRSASALSEMSQRLSVSRTLDEIAHVVVRHASAASGADHVAVGFINEARNELRVHHSPVGSNGVSLAEDPESFTIGIDPQGAVITILRRGQPILFDGPDPLRQFPEIDALVGDRLRRVVCKPLIDADGELRGVIGFVYVSGSDAVLDPEAGRLDTIADLTAQTVERSLLYQHEHELVVNLQRQTLADLPDVDGLRSAARYLPASSLLGLGGDWYDVYVLEDGRTGVVVGDVAGHGIGAIADMTEFRTTISTLLRTSANVGSLPAMSTILLNDDGRTELRYATAGLMILDRERATMSYIRAGHPPAMLRCPGGEVVVLEHGGGAPIGIETAIVEETHLDLQPGSVLVAYTDGLIERRDESIDIGLARLADALSECMSTDPDAIADALIAICHDGRQTEDDTAVLVIVVD